MSEVIVDSMTLLWDDYRIVKDNKCLNMTSDVIDSLMESLKVPLRKGSTEEYVRKFVSLYIDKSRSKELLERLFIGLSNNDGGEISVKNKYCILGYLMRETPFVFSGVEQANLIRNNSQRDFSSMIEIIVGDYCDFFRERFSDNLDVMDYFNSMICENGLDKNIFTVLQKRAVEKRLFFMKNGMKNILRFCNRYPEFIVILNEIYSKIDSFSWKTSILDCFLESDADIKNYLEKYPANRSLLRSEVYDKDARVKDGVNQVYYDECYLIRKDLTLLITELGSKTTFTDSLLLKELLIRVIGNTGWVIVNLGGIDFLKDDSSTLTMVIKKHDTYDAQEIMDIINFMLLSATTLARNSGALNLMLETKYDKNKYSDD